MFLGETRWYPGNLNMTVDNTFIKMETLKWDGIIAKNTVVKTPAGDETYREVFPWQ